MKRIYFIFFIVILSACNNRKDKKSISKSLVTNNQQQNLGKDSTGKFIKKDSMKNIHKDARSKVNGSGLLFGFWGTVGELEGNASFYIRGENIYYEDNNKSYKYIVKADTIKIFYEESAESFGYKFSGDDTLTLTDIYGASKFYRIKK